MIVQTTFNDKLKKHSSHHAFIPDWMHYCVEWYDCKIIIENVEQKNEQVSSSVTTYSLNSAVENDVPAWVQACRNTQNKQK